MEYFTFELRYLARVRSRRAILRGEPTDGGLEFIEKQGEQDEAEPVDAA